MKRVFILFFLCTLILSGCSGILKRDSGMNTANLLEPQAIAKFSDVPVPAGFQLLPQVSYSFENSGVRVGLLKYQGKADVDQVVNFYKEQMAMYNWRLLNIVEYGECMLNFDREQETCIVNLLANGKQITITIAVGPKAQFPKKEKKPLK